MLHNGMQPDSRNDRASGGEYARKIILLTVNAYSLIWLNE